MTKEQHPGDREAVAAAPTAGLDESVVAQTHLEFGDRSVRRGLPTPGPRDLERKIIDDHARLASGGRRFDGPDESSGDEVGELGTHQRVIRGTPSLLDLATGQLSEAVAASCHSDGQHGPAVDNQSLKLVLAQVADLLQGVAQLDFALGLEIRPPDRPVVGHSQQDHSTLRVGERHRRLADRPLRETFLEFHMLAFDRKLSRELLSGELERAIEAA